MTKAKTTKADVTNAVTEMAREKIECEPRRFGKIADPGARLAAAKSEIWRENPEARELHRLAPDEPDPVREAPVLKGAEASAVALAKQKLANDPDRFEGMSPNVALAAARSEVWAERPDLREAR